MNKQTINVPKGIRFISEWEEFSLPENPCIINKQITGCGFTEWAITCPQHTIIVSPRKILLENKESQHQGELLYLKNEVLDQYLDFDKDLSSTINSAKQDKSDSIDYSSAIISMKDQAINYYNYCIISNKWCKMTITYDSFGHLKQALESINRLGMFQIVVDEFQSIFTDSRFKSSTEMEFLNHLRGINKLCFVSATPMLDKYLDMLDEFNTLDYYTLDWGALDPSRVIKPQLEVKSCRSIVTVSREIIEEHRKGVFRKSIVTDENNNFQEIESRELVIYVNSVKNICDIVKKCELKPDEVNILCAKTPDNIKKVRKAFGLTKKDDFEIGKVPKRDEPHKMFTFCTRTVYLGADFYSTCARSIILSDANIDCMAVDILLDLPQILGRQRLNENPWKNRAELYFKVISGKKSNTSEEFVKMISQKKANTENLLLAYSQVSDPRAKHVLTINYQKVAKTFNYKEDYVAVNTHGGKDLFPVFNNLVMVAELRAFEVQQIDYRDRFTVFNSLIDYTSVSNSEIENSCNNLEDFLYKFNEFRFFTDKMRLLCESNISNVLEVVPIEYKNYYITLGPEKIKSLSYQKSKLEEEYNKLKNNQDTIFDFINELIVLFPLNSRVSYIEIKKSLSDLYTKIGLIKSPKATDLLEYFEVKKIKITIDDGKRVDGYEILSIKTQDL